MRIKFVEGLGRTNGPPELRVVQMEYRIAKALHGPGRVTIYRRGISRAKFQAAAYDPHRCEPAVRLGHQDDVRLRLALPHVPPTTPASQATEKERRADACCIRV
jgi:hypothetical protein